ncbi:hypothetical protein P3607_18940, partial [Vibrio parahaemolyticus]|nr:hypothetical protein [Vibrio parahaemolyticus]MDG3059018.1 hypothetical protein [Vibrio parahaemolyticus]
RRNLMPHRACSILWHKLSREERSDGVPPNGMNRPKLLAARENAQQNKPTEETFHKGDNQEQTDNRPELN